MPLDNAWQKACQSASTRGRPHLSLAMWSTLMYDFHVPTSKLWAPQSVTIYPATKHLDGAAPTSDSDPPCTIRTMTVLRPRAGLLDSWTRRDLSHPRHQEPVVSGTIGPPSSLTIHATKNLLVFKRTPLSTKARKPFLPAAKQLHGLQHCLRYHASCSSGSRSAAASHGFPRNRSARARPRPTTHPGGHPKSAGATPTP